MACPEIHVESGQFPSGFVCCGPTTFFGVGFEINPELVDAPKHSISIWVFPKIGVPPNHPFQ